MTPLTSLIVPIVLSSILVFFASSLVHMVLPWHKSDYPKLANEDQVMDALRSVGLPPGDYMLPKPNDMNDLKSPEFQAKFNKGPVVMMTVMPPGPMNMNPQLARWFVFILVVGVFSAYVAAHTLGPSAMYLDVFRIVGTVAFCSYSLAYWPMSIWYRRSVAITWKQQIDGLLYAMLTAGVFGWRWPH